MQATDSVQDYLKAVYSLTEGGAEVSTTALADRLQVSPASVTAMIKRLAERGLLEHRRYRGVALTETGLEMALEVIRHHRLLEAYLHKTLGMSWDKVHDEAEVLEHAISEEVEDRISEALGNPTHDPHGDPIPPKRGKHKIIHHSPLGEIAGGPVRVERVSDRDPAVLRYLAKLGLKPGASLTVDEHSPFGGPVWVKVGRRRHPIGRELAGLIYVSRPVG